MRVKTDASRTVFDIVKDKGLNHMLIFQVNIAFYHWFFVLVDFNKGEMIVHDSLINPILNNEANNTRCDIPPATEDASILSCLTDDTRLEELKEDSLHSLCKMVGIRVGGCKTEFIRPVLPFFDSFQKSSPFVLPLNRAKDALRRKLEKCNLRWLDRQATSRSLEIIR